ncbi:MAG: hypothetical protein QM503_02645 [Bacteroidota bacterium]
MNILSRFISGILIALVFMIFLMIFTQKTYGQTSDTLRYCIETTDGNKFIGHLQNSDSSTFIINTIDYGILHINVDKVDKVYQVSSNTTGVKEYWHRNIQSARYFWAPNGYGLKKGEGYYQNYWVLFNQFSYGFTDYFSVGMGMVPLFLFGGTSTPLWITPKFSVPVVKDKVNVGVGGLFGAVVGEDGAGFGLAYGTATYGSRDKNISFGLGWGYAGGEWANTPLVNISGIIRVGKKGGYIMTENYFINFGSDEFMALLSIGGRNLINSVSIDYGLFIPIVEDIDTFIGIPWLGITIPFKRKN